MKERPILFISPMVRALLDGSKTQTRRVAKLTDAAHVKEPRGHRRWHPGDPAASLACPYGKPGDRLWVRQEHYRFGHWEAVPGAKTKGRRQKWKFVADHDQTLYEAPEQYRKGRHHKDPSTPAWHKRLARFMPRALSVITLELTAVRVEQLQDISEADAEAEGIERSYDQWRDYRTDQAVNYPSAATPIESYRTLWESINGAGSWEANPFVWVIEFKNLEGAAS